MNLPVYKTLEEKKGWFHQFVINTETDLQNILSYHRADPKYIYRGLGEAKYKLFNSYQRFHNPELNEQQSEFRYHNRTAINEAQEYQNWLLKRYLDSINCLQKDYATLSFLQHHGAPTPLLDFTTSQDIGLFFMSQKSCVESKNEIDNYFSLYMIDSNFLFSANDFRKEYTDFLEANSEKIAANYESVKPEIEFQLSIDSKLLNPMIELIDEGQQNYKFKMFLNNSLNIISQKGKFLLNTFPNHPLEEAFKIDIKNRDENPNSEIDKKNFIVSIDIHKSLKDLIDEHLIKNKIVYETVFPKTEKIVDYIKGRKYEI